MLERGDKRLVTRARPLPMDATLCALSYTVGARLTDTRTGRKLFQWECEGAGAEGRARAQSPARCPKWTPSSATHRPNEMVADQAKRLKRRLRPTLSPAARRGSARACSRGWRRLDREREVPSTSASPSTVAGSPSVTAEDRDGAAVPSPA